MKSKTILAVLVILLGLISFTVQAVPSAISYQGYLTGPSGTPIDGNVDITFSLYDADSAGSLSWQETQISIAVSKGLFKVELGSISPFATGQFDIPMWLGIKVGVDAEMSPRLPLSSVGYALKAEDAETLGGLNSVELNQSAHVTDTTNPHNVTAVQAGAASITELGSHTSNSANPHNVTVAQTGAASASAFSTHSTDAAAHHARYQNSEAVSAMAVKADSNPLHHDKYSNAQAVAAIKADAGIGFNADTVDNLHANEIIDAASDEVRIPIPNDGNTFFITVPGSYYLTGHKIVANADAIVVTVGRVKIDLMGYSLQGNGSAKHGILINNFTEHVVIQNGYIWAFGNSGIYSGSAKFIQVLDVYADRNGSVSTANDDSGIVLYGVNNLIERCVSSGNSGSGIVVGFSSTIQNNRVSGNGFDGIQSSDSSIIMNNISYNNSRQGILAGNGNNIMNNTSYGNSVGLGVDSSNNIVGNTLYENKGVGIYTRNGNNILNNTLSLNNSTNPAQAQAGGLRVLENNRVKGNTLDNNKHNNIFVSGPRNIIEENHVTNSNPGNGINFLNSYNLYRNNSASGNTINYAGSLPPAVRDIDNISW